MGIIIVLLKMVKELNKEQCERWISWELYLSVHELVVILLICDLIWIKKKNDGQISILSLKAQPTPIFLA